MELFSFRPENYETIQIHSLTMMEHKIQITSTYAECNFKLNKTFHGFQVKLSIWNPSINNPVEFVHCVTVEHANETQVKLK